MTMASQVSRCGVVGHPIEHSLSPALHTAAYESLGISDEWSYSKHDVQPDELGAFISGLDSSWRGLSVTMPHKQEAFDVAHDLDAHAELTGAVNTLLFAEIDGSRHISGFNTDVHGIVSAISSKQTRPLRHIAVIGGGATASSAIVAAAELGAEYVSVVVRNVAKAQPLIDIGHRAGLRVQITESAELAPVEPIDAAISTLPGTVEFDLGPLSRSDGAILLDVSYDPWPSHKSIAWSDAGGVTVSGLHMLAAQALIQVRIFTTGDPFQELPREEFVLSAMFASVGLN